MENGLSYKEPYNGIVMELVNHLFWNKIRVKGVRLKSSQRIEAARDVSGYSNNVWTRPWTRRTFILAYEEWFRKDVLKALGFVHDCYEERILAHR